MDNGPYGNNYYEHYGLYVLIGRNKKGRENPAFLLFALLFFFLFVAGSGTLVENNGYADND